jgi:hypothetical protein
MFWQDWLVAGSMYQFSPLAWVYNSPITNSPIQYQAREFTGSKMPLATLSIQPITLYLNGTSILTWYSMGLEKQNFLA